MKRYGLIGLFLLLFFFDCSKDIASSTETDTGEIIGWVVNAERQVVGDAEVILRNAEYVQMIGAGNNNHFRSLGKVTTQRKTRIDSTKTSPGGFFSFGSVTPGNYYIEVNDYDSHQGNVVEAHLPNADTVCSVDTITLKPFGNIRGGLDASIRKGDSAFIYIVELDRKVPLDSLGHFLISNIPAVDYSVRIVDGINIVPSVLDTVIISVTEQDTADAYNLGSPRGDILIEGIIREH